MKALSWNVQGAFPPNGSKERISDQVSFITDTANRPDLLLLNEVTSIQQEYWHDLLEAEGYIAIVDTLDWALELRESEVPPHQEFNHVNGNLIAIHEESKLQNLSRRSPSIRNGPYDNSPLKHWSTNFPEKILNAEVDYGDTTLSLWNIRTVPGNMYGEEKIKILENTYHRILVDEDYPCILAGDFNAPKDETPDGEVISWGVDRPGELGDRWTQAELDILTGLEQVGMVDVFRTIHGYGDIDAIDFSHPTGDKGKPLTGLRFDHIIASRDLNPVSCEYELSGFECCSDHLPLIAEFGPDS